MIDIFILSLVQGITEFIPVSSSSHLILFSDYVNFENKSLSIDVSLHIGSFLAVVTYFYKEILNFVKNKELFFKVLLSSIPVMISGFILVKTNLIDNFRIIEIIGWTTLLFGILLFISDKFNLEKNLNKDFSYKYALIIGIFQVLSLIPGVSRSGIVITATRFLNFNRVDSGKISFLLSIPALSGASFLGLWDISSETIEINILIIIATILSFLFSYLTVKFFLNYLNKFSLKIFVVYRILIGLILLSIIYL